MISGKQTVANWFGGFAIIGDSDQCPLGATFTLTQTTIKI
jgi:hypothetical protein